MSAHPPLPPDGGSGAGGDPSMEDILASIRRILSEDEAASPSGSPPQPSVAHPPEVLALDASMLVDEPKRVLREEVVPLPGRGDLPALHADRAPELPLQPAAPPAPAPEPVALPDTPIEAAQDRTDMPATEPSHAAPPAAAGYESGSLVAPEAAAAAASSVGSLLRTIGTRQNVAVARGGPTIEDMVREELRPALKAWLDANLPPMVERLVRAEIERVVGRADG